MGKDEEIKYPFQLGRYTILQLIGKGGMGEVFLAEDPICGRQVALKRVLPKRKGKAVSRERFKKEVKITAQLSHPSIVPIYDLYEDDEGLYYTMPYLQGDTLRMILTKTRIADEKGRAPHPMGGSVPALMVAFLSLCQAIEHTHAKGFIHRDLKPENIIIGKYNEVTILDWGVATEIRDPKESKQIEKCAPAGTIDYMAPERAFRKPASVKTDIYSLGVILHLMLTLRLPYRRPRDLKEWRALLKEKGYEPPVDPQEIAPHREITRQLTRITLKCLHPDPKERYDSVKEIITEMQHYIEGRPDWIPMQSLDVREENDWEFQESVVLTKQMAISRYAGVMEWILLMLSKESYSGNIQAEATICLQENSGGIGILMCVPENSNREGLEKGFLLWIGSKETPGCKLFRDNVEVTRIDDLFLEPETPHQIAVERQDNVIRLLINDQQKMVYTSHVPLVGGHFGVASRDVEFEMSPIKLSSGSQNVLVNCLSVPDAFLLNKDYDRAITEYRRIASSFKGRPEGREARFRAGYTFIEQAKHSKEPDYFQQALDEFETLHHTPGAPIEYLGKSLVYQAEKNLEEEIKCLELGVRKFSKHPLRHILDDQILYRLHETAQNDRIGAYAYTLLALRHIPNIYNLKEIQRLTKNLTISWEQLPFLHTPPLNDEREQLLQLSIQLSFWLARPNTIYELIHALPEDYKHRLPLLENGLLALLELQYPKLIDFTISKKYLEEKSSDFLLLKNLFEIAVDDIPLSKKLTLALPKASAPFLYSLFSQGLSQTEAPELLPYFKKAPDSLHIWALLLSGKKEDAKALFEEKPIHDPTSPFFTLYGCYLAASAGEEKARAHFDPLLEATFPRSPTLLGHFLKGTIDIEGSWFQKAFLWEKIQLYRQLVLYHTCLGDSGQAAHYETLITKETSAAAIPLHFI